MSEQPRTLSLSDLTRRETEIVFQRAGAAIDKALPPGTGWVLLACDADTPHTAYASNVDRSKLPEALRVIADKIEIKLTSGPQLPNLKPTP